VVWAILGGCKAFVGGVNPLLLRHLASFLGAFVLGLYLVPVMIQTSKKLRILDVPDGKIKNHKAPVPYMGGVAIYLSFIIVLALIFPLEAKLLWFVLGVTLLLFVGLIDDFKALAPLQKLGGQIIAVACFLKGGFALKSRFFAGYLNIAASSFWMLSVINAFNLVDVMDGLAATLAVVAAGAFLIIAVVTKQYMLSLFLTALLGGLCAFLWYNKPSAKIYLGDAGSLFVGGFIAATPLLIRWTEVLIFYDSLPSFAEGNVLLETGVSALVPVLLVGVPLLEVFSLIVIRKSKGLPFYSGSPHHFALYLQRKKWSVWRVLAFAASVAIILSAAALLFMFGYISFMVLLWSVGLLLLFWTLMIFW